MDTKSLHIDYELLIQMRDGNEDAFGVVFQTYYRYLYVLAYRYLLSEFCAQDAVQQVFLQLWEIRKSLDYSYGIKNLLFTMMKNHLLNEIKHNNLIVQKNYELAQQTDETIMDCSSAIEETELRKYLNQLVKNMTPQKREIYRLKIQQGLTNQQVADQLDITVFTVKTHYTQVVKYLRRHLNKIFIPVMILLFSMF